MYVKRKIEAHSWTIVAVESNECYTTWWDSKQTIEKLDESVFMFASCINDN